MAQRKQRYPPFLCIVIGSLVSLEYTRGVLGITRSEVISNAETWLHPPVPYSQTKYKDGYRTDCSGYVSMAWELGSSYTTMSLPSITSSISKDDLQAGDILLNPGSHVVIFDSWANDAKTSYTGYEQAGGRLRQTTKRIITYPYGRLTGYAPRRYNNIQ